MIVQGSNEPIIFKFDDINDVPEDDIHVTLKNEITILKQWGMGDLDINLNPNVMEIKAPITQEESMTWEEGPCWIELKYLDHWNNTIFSRVKTDIIPWTDQHVLEESSET